MPTYYFLLGCSYMFKFYSLHGFVSWFGNMSSPSYLAIAQIKSAIKSAEHSVKEFIFGPDKGIQGGSKGGKPISNSAEKQP